MRLPCAKSDHTQDGTVQHEWGEGPVAEQLEDGDVDISRNLGKFRRVAQARRTQSTKVFVAIVAIVFAVAGFVVVGFAVGSSDDRRQNGDSVRVSSVLGRKDEGVETPGGPITDPVIRFHGPDLDVLD